MLTSCDRAGRSCESVTHCNEKNYIMLPQFGRNGLLSRVSPVVGLAGPKTPAPSDSATSPCSADVCTGSKMFGFRPDLRHTRI